MTRRRGPRPLTEKFAVVRDEVDIAYPAGTFGQRAKSRAAVVGGLLAIAAVFLGVLQRLVGDTFVHRWVWLADEYLGVTSPFTRRVDLPTIGFVPRWSLIVAIVAIVAAFVWAKRGRVAMAVIVAFAGVLWWAVDGWLRLLLVVVGGIVISFVARVRS